MAKGMNFSAVLSLQKKQFDRGIKEVQGTLKGLQSSFLKFAGSLGAGLGLYQLVGSLKNTAQQLSVVQATLENVSESTTEYSDNLAFIQKIAKEYGQDQNALIGSFAKMRAAAGAAGVELGTIRTTFEALTRAAGAYHLSADQTANAMMAIEQMFGKSTVMSEELRRQLANSLPAAVAVFAKAAGRAGITVNGTVAELQKAMKNGEVITKDIMPYVAEVLNEQTKNANFDSLQASMNRFRNAWLDFVQNINAEGFFNGLYKAGTSALNGIGKAAKFLGIDLSNIFMGALVGAPFAKASIDLRKARIAATEQEKILTAELEKQREILGQQERLYASRQTMLQNRYGGNLNAKTGNWDFPTAANPNQAAFAASRSLPTLAANIETTKATIADVQKGLENCTKQTNLWTRAGMVLKNGFNGLKGVLAGILSVAVWTAIFTVISNIVSKVIEWVKWQRELNELPTKGVEDARQISESTSKTVAEVKQLYEIYNDVNNSEKDRQVALNRINKHLDLQGEKMFTLASNAEEVKNAIEGWEEGFKASQEQEQLNQALTDANTKIEEYQSRLKQIREDDDYGKTLERQRVLMDGSVEGYERLTAKATSLAKEEAKINKELNAQILLRQNLIAAGASPIPKEDATWTWSEDEMAVMKALEDYSRSQQYLNNQMENGRFTQAEYNKELSKTADKTFDLISKTKGLQGVVNTLGKDEKKGIDYVALYSDVLANKGKNKGGSGGGTKAPEDEMKKALDEYTKARAKLDNQYAHNLISGDEYREGLKKEIKEVQKVAINYKNLEEHLKSLGAGYQTVFNEVVESFHSNSQLMDFMDLMDQSIDKLEEEIDKVQELSVEAEGLMAQGMPQLGKRDSFFDYKKTDAEILKEGVDKLEDYSDKLKDLRDNLQRIKAEMGSDWTPEMQAFLDEVIKKLTEAGFATEVLSEKAKFAELTKDVKDFKRELDDAKFDNLKNVAQSFDRLTQGIESVKNAMETIQDGGDGWLDQLRAMISIISELIQVLETFKAIQEGIKKVQEATAAYEKAAAAEKAASYTAQVAGLGKAAAAETASAGATIAAETAKQAALDTTTASAGAAAVAGATSSQAAIPVVGPILAAAAAAAIIGVLAAGIAKAKGFATGGIVNGPKTGDKNLIRANGGEMILNGRQQQNLFDMIDRGTAGKNSEVQFKIRGADLVGTINNYNSRTRG